MKYSSLVATLFFLAACDPALSPDYAASYGRINGTIHAQNAVMPIEGDVRVALVWLTGDLLNPSLIAEDVEVTGAFPAAFKLDLTKPAPVAASSATHEALAAVVVYADGNTNSALDFVDFNALTMPDRVLGIVSRFFLAYSATDGFRWVTMNADGSGTYESLDKSLNIELTGTDELQSLLCLNAPSFEAQARPDATTSIYDRYPGLDAAAVACSADGRSFSLTFDVASGACHPRAVQVTTDVEDLASFNTIPSDWPCTISEPQEASIVGTWSYKIPGVHNEHLFSANHSCELGYSTGKSTGHESASTDYCTYSVADGFVSIDVTSTLDMLTNETAFTHYRTRVPFVQRANNELWFDNIYERRSGTGVSGDWLLDRSRELIAEDGSVIFTEIYLQRLTLGDDASATLETTASTETDSVTSVQTGTFELDTAGRALIVLDTIDGEATEFTTVYRMELLGADRLGDVVANPYKRKP